MPGPVQSVERAAAILRLLSRGSGHMGLGDIATACDLAKGTAHGLVRTLLGVGFVEQDQTTGRYRLGAALLPLGAGYLDVNELRARSVTWAEALAIRTGEAVRVGMPLEVRVLVVHHVVRPDHALQALEVGALLPPHATALGKVLLGHDPGMLAALRATEPERHARRTVVGTATLNRELAAAREAGWAGEAHEHHDGEAGIAAPIRGHGGQVVGAIGISGAAERVLDAKGRPEATLVSCVRDAARAVSRDLGATRW